MATLGRIKRELAELRDGLGYAVVTRPKDPWSLDVLIMGPEGGPYEGGTFHVLLTIPVDYPLAPPLVAFQTPCLHPAVRGATGEVSGQVFSDAWTPQSGVRSVVEALADMLRRFDSVTLPLEPEIGRLVSEAPLVFVVECKKMVRKYATEPI